MGNSLSRDNCCVERSAFSLDELGGWDRPAIRRGDSLNKKLEWLQVRQGVRCACMDGSGV